MPPPLTGNLPRVQAAVLAHLLVGPVAAGTLFDDAVHHRAHVAPLEQSAQGVCFPSPSTLPRRCASLRAA